MLIKDLSCGIHEKLEHFCIYLILIGVAVGSRENIGTCTSQLIFPLTEAKREEAISVRSFHSGPPWKTQTISPLGKEREFGRDTNMEEMARRILELK